MRRLFAALAATFVLLLAACGDDDDASIDRPGEDEPVISSTTAEAGAEDKVDGEAPTDATGSVDGAVVRAEDGVLTDGVWAVGDAGTVDFAVTDAGLQLIGHEAAEGWTARVDDDGPEEIEVEFRRDNRQFEFEVDYDDGTLEVEIHLDIDGAHPGTFTLGPAGSGSIGTSGEDATLEDLDVAEGWTVTEQDTSDGEVELELRRDGIVWELDAEVDDGRLEISVDFQIEGRFP